MTSPIVNPNTIRGINGYQPIDDGKPIGKPPVGGSSVAKSLLLPQAEPKVPMPAGASQQASVIVDGAGLRHDNGKPMYDLLPPEFLDALALYFTQAGGPVGGPRKYPLRNWERGMAWTRCFGALMRHAWKWMRGEDYDAETGAHHMIAVAWNASVLYAYAVRQHGTDDRPRYVVGKVPEGE